MRVRHRGFALILVLLATAAVFAVAVQTAAMSRASAVESRVVAERAEAERNARSAVVMVLTGLGTSVERFARQTVPAGSSAGGAGGLDGSTGDDKPRIEIPDIIKQVLGDRLKEVEEEASRTVGDAARLTEGGGITGRASGPVRGSLRISELPPKPVVVRLEEGGPVFVVSLADASGLLNVNTATRDRLIRYFDAVGVEAGTASDLASQIIDWRDEDDFTSPGGAEQSVYALRGITCRNGPMKSLEELRYLPAMTPDLFERVRHDLSVGAGEKVHAGTASRALLMSLPGMTGDTVDRLIEARLASPLRKEDLDRLIPLQARESRDLMRVEPSPILRVRVHAVGETSAMFEGLAMLDEDGIRAVGLRPVF